MNKLSLGLIVVSFLSGCSVNKLQDDTKAYFGVAGTLESSIYKFSSSVNISFNENGTPEIDGTHGYFNAFLAYSKELDQFMAIRIPNPKGIMEAKDCLSYQHFCGFIGKDKKTWQAETVDLDFVQDKNFFGQEKNYFTIDFIIKSNTSEKFITEKVNLMIYENKAFLTYLSSPRFDNKKRKLDVFFNRLVGF